MSHRKVLRNIHQPSQKIGYLVKIQCADGRQRYRRAVGYQHNYFLSTVIINSYKLPNSALS